MARIIYVEDDPLVGEMVQQVLTRAGHLIGVVAHGGLGYDTIAFKRPDLVILDRALPGMGGIEILTALRGLAGLYLTPIMILSAKGSDADIAEAMSAGANDYLVKPFEPEELVRRVAEVLKHNDLRRGRGPLAAKPPTAPGTPGRQAP